MAMEPKVAAPQRGAPYEFPNTPRKVGQNFKRVMELLQKMEVPRTLKFTDFRAVDPAEPPRGQGDAYIFDDGGTIVLRVRYNDEGTIKTGDVTLA